MSQTSSLLNTQPQIRKWYFIDHSIGCFHDYYPPTTKQLPRSSTNEHHKKNEYRPINGNSFSPGNFIGKFHIDNFFTREKNERNELKKRGGRRGGEEEKSTTQIQLTLPTEVCNATCASITRELRFPACFRPWNVSYSALVRLGKILLWKLWKPSAIIPPEEFRRRITRFLAREPPLNRDLNEAWWRSIFPLVARDGIKISTGNFPPRYRNRISRPNVERNISPTRDPEYSCDEWCDMGRMKVTSLLLTEIKLGISVRLHSCVFIDAGDISTFRRVFLLRSNRLD